MWKEVATYFSRSKRCAHHYVERKEWLIMKEIYRKGQITGLHELSVTVFVTTMTSRLVTLRPTLTKS